MLSLSLSLSLITLRETLVCIKRPRCNPVPDAPSAQTRLKSVPPQLESSGERPCLERARLERYGWPLSCNRCAARGSAPHATRDDLYASASFALSVARSFRNAVHAACDRCHCGTLRAGNDAYGRFSSCVHGRSKSHKGVIGDFAASRRMAGRQMVPHGLSFLRVWRQS